LIFSSDDLRNLIHLQEADILSARKARAAIEAITEFYRRDGSIDSVLAPILDMDDQNQRSSRLMEIAKEKQYRWGEGRGFWS
jgi:outer membrane protein assembly factor BamA